MRIAEMDWRMVEDWARSDDRAVLPLGSTEQHGQLSLATDTILAERLAVEAAEPLGVPVFPALPYGFAAAYTAFPGTVTLRAATYAAVLRDVLDSLKRSGFRRLLIVSSHSDHSPAAGIAQEWMMDHPDARVRFHCWWAAPATAAAVRAIDPIARHGGWLDNFPFTRVPGSEPAEGGGAVIDIETMATLPPFEVREMIGDGFLGGLRRREDHEMQAIWDVALRETQEILGGW